MRGSRSGLGVGIGGRIADAPVATPGRKAAGARGPGLGVGCRGLRGAARLATPPPGPQGGAGDRRADHGAEEEALEERRLVALVAAADAVARGPRNGTDGGSRRHPALPVSDRRSGPRIARRATTAI